MAGLVTIPHDLHHGRRATPAANQEKIMPNRVIHTAAGDGVRLNTVDSIATVKVAAADTTDEYELFEIEAPEGPGVPRHRHPWAEAYYVLDGTLDVQVGARTYRMSTGDSITVPPNVVHSIASCDGVCRFLAFSLTAGTGALFADLDRTIPTDKSIEEIVPLVLSVAERNGVSFLGGPPA
jgi:quercetin dioxygenase-like cupin family protein